MHGRVAQSPVAPAFQLVGVLLHMHLSGNCTALSPADGVHIRQGPARVHSGMHRNARMRPRPVSKGVTASQHRLARSWGPQQTIAQSLWCEPSTTSQLCDLCRYDAYMTACLFAQLARLAEAQAVRKLQALTEAAEARPDPEPATGGPLAHVCMLPAGSTDGWP